MESEKYYFMPTRRTKIKKNECNKTYWMKNFNIIKKSKTGMIVVLTGRMTTFYTLLPSPMESNTSNVRPRILATLQEFI